MNVACIACVVVSLSVVTSAQAKDPVAGAWEQTAVKNLVSGLTDTPQSPPMRVIYANGYYVQFSAAADRANTDKPADELTRDELVDRIRIAGQSGTYLIKGEQLIRKIISAVAPANEGREVTFDFRIEGDTLILTRENANSQKIETRFRKLQ
jgi:hypothetical protein